MACAENGKAVKEPSQSCHEKSTTHFGDICIIAAFNSDDYHNLNRPGRQTVSVHLIW